MRPLSTRTLLGLAAVAAVVLTGTVSGAATASRGSDDSRSVLIDDNGGGIDRDLRVESGDDRQPNGSSASRPVSPSAAPTNLPRAVPTAGASSSASGSRTYSSATKSSRTHSSATNSSATSHDVGDDHGRRRGGHGADDSSGRGRDDDGGRGRGRGRGGDD